MSQAEPKNAQNDPRADDQPSDPRRRRTRQAIIRAGQTLFGQHHPDGVSTDELIRAAKVSKQSFYNHFVDKDDLAHEILRMTRAEIDALVDEVNVGQTDPAKRLASALCVYARHALLNPEQGQLIARLPFDDIAVESDTNSRVVSDLNEGLLQGRLAIFTLETGVAFVIATAQALINRVLGAPQPTLAVVTGQQFVTLVLRAFGLAPIEAELIASEAANRIIRLPA